MAGAKALLIQLSDRISTFSQADNFKRHLSLSDLDPPAKRRCLGSRCLASDFRLLVQRRQRPFSGPARRVKRSRWSSSGLVPLRNDAANPSGAPLLRIERPRTLGGQTDSRRVEDKFDGIMHPIAISLIIMVVVLTVFV